MEKLKYKEAEKYASTLLFAEPKGVINHENIPGEFVRCINKFIKHDAEPDYTLRSDASKENIIEWLYNSLPSALGNNIYFKSSYLYWKFWLDLKIVDIKKFINNAIDTGVKDLTIIYVNNKVIIYLSSEENSYWIFVKEPSQC